MSGPTVLRIAPEYRRSAIYALIAVVPLWLILFWVAHFIQGNAPWRAAARGTPFLLLGLAMIVPLRWALRIDETGMARRILFRWDAWSWEELASGRIEKRHPLTLVDPARPWWRRRLALSYLQAADMALVIQRINAVYRLPDPSPLPEVLAIKYGFRRSARFDSQGILLEGKESRAYLWSEVGRVHITRIEPLRRDFTNLELVLPDREIELKFISHQGGRSPTWRGATAEVVSEFLTRYVPPERIDTDFYGERPARRIDVERMLAKTNKQRRDFGWCFVIAGAMVGGLLIWAAMIGRLLAAVVMTALFSISYGPIYWWMLARLRSRCAELERTLANFDEGQR
jgi:hypothetical protein